MTTFFQDLRFAARSLAKSPGFALAAVLTLALGIGANTAVFSLVRGVLLRPLPFPRPERLVAVHEANLEKSTEPMTASPPNFLDWQAQNRVFSALGAYTAIDVALADGGEPEQLRATAATPGFFAALGVAPLHGRTFTNAETVPGRDRVAVLSHALWTRRLGADRDRIGRTVRLNGETYLTVGVMPPGFRFPESDADLWIPLVFGPDIGTQRGAHYLEVVGRLADGTTVAGARTEMDGIAGRLRAQYRSTNEGYGAAVIPLREDLVGPIRPTLTVLLGAVGFVTLLACANVANLLLIRASRRGPEMAIRTALGAGRARLVRQLLTESLVLAAAGTAAGLALAAGAVDLIVRFGPSDIPRLGDVRIDGGVLAFTAAWTLACAFLFGLAPALAAVRSQPMNTLRGAGVDKASGRGGSRLRRLLVVGQMGIALLLLTGAGLLARSLVRLASVDPGFRPDSALTFALSLPDSRYSDEPKAAAFTEELLGRLRALPGVRDAGAIFGLPLTGMSFSSSFRVEGTPEDPADERSAELRVASRDYFRAAGIPLQEGRLFEKSDRRGSPLVILVSRAAARKFWPAGDALGQRVRFGARPAVTRLEGEIVGIVGDVRDGGLAIGPTPEFYGCMEQAPVGYFSVVVRTSGPPALVAPLVRREVHALDPELPVTSLATFEDVVSRSVAGRRFPMLLLLAFASLALLLSGVGIYGVTAYGVSQRTREIGIRLALGAEGRQIRRLVLREGLRLALAGLAVGLAAALALTRLLAGLLFEVRPADPATYVGTGLLMLGVALAACWIPARRASALDPSIALRSE